MGKIGDFFYDIAKETVRQRDDENYNLGRQHQFTEDIQIFVAALQDNKITKEKIMDFLYDYFEIADRGLAIQIIEDSQQWRKNIKPVKQIKNTK